MTPPERVQPPRVLTDDNLARAREIIALYPHSKSAVLPLLHLVQDQEGWISDDAMREVAALLGLQPAQVLGTCSFYTMFKRDPVGRLVVSVCTNVSCYVNGGPELYDALQQRYSEDADVTVEEVECLAACDQAPVLQVNYEYHGPLTPEVAEDLVEDYKSGRLTPRTVSGSQG